jgi:23S rRNA pseudouridine2605 synthase
MAQNQHEGERIAKVIARAGLCSRREAEAWIAAGRVAVNGEKIASPALNVTLGDKIVVDGKPLPGVERTRLFLYHKPRGLVTTSSDPQGRPTIFGALPNDLPRLISIGRLDLATEGLLLLTNDGGLARALELPSTAWLRRYRVRAHGTVTQDQLDALREGVTVDGIRYGAIDATLDREQASNVWITFAIREGKNREVRNVLRHLNLHVARLIRVSFGPFQLKELGAGEIEEVPTRVLRDQLGEKLARAAGADFSAPIVQRKQEPDRIDAEPASRERPRRGAASPLPPRAKRDGGEAGSPSRQRDGVPRSGVGGRSKPDKSSSEKKKFHRPRRGENARPSFDERDPPTRFASRTTLPGRRGRDKRPHK